MTKKLKEPSIRTLRKMLKNLIRREALESRQFLRFSLKTDEEFLDGLNKNLRVCDLARLIEWYGTISWNNAYELGRKLERDLIEGTK